MTDGMLSPAEDADGDGISDTHEGRDAAVDTDADGQPDYLDPDSDADGVSDQLEGKGGAGAPPDSDMDGTPDFRDLDSDGNGISDAVEGGDDLDGDNKPNSGDVDDDGDQISDSTEIGGTAATPRDSDGDGMPDYRDVDSDGDTIRDLEEGGERDTDMDGTADALDLDSDADTIPDALEAGDADIATPARDFDEDGIKDFRDPDSDGDGLADAQEAGISSPIDVDSDDDGVTDLVEVSAGTDPTDMGDNPAARGNFVFVVEYSEPTEAPIPPAPPRSTLSFSTALKKVDVYFAIDNSGSMDGEIANLQAGFTSSIVPTIAARIPSAQFGVGRFKDCPSGTGNMANLVNVTADTAAVQAGINSFGASAGNAEPYHQMLWMIATGNETRLPGTAGRTCTDPATIGWPCFRPDAVKIIIQVGDEPMSQSNACSSRNVTVAEAVAEMNARSIRYIGVWSSTPQLRTDMENVGRMTGSVGGAGGAPFVYEVNSDGSGLSTAVVDGVAELASSISIRVDAIPHDDPTDAVDAVASFVDHIETNTSGVEVLGKFCTNIPSADGTDPDTINDFYPAVTPGTSVCFDIVAKPNQVVPALPVPQIFRATIDVIGDEFTPLDSREIIFLVPPVILDPGEIPG